MRAALATLLAALAFLPVLAADPPAFDGSRKALTIPDDVWERVLADGGRAGRAIGYGADEMRAFGKDDHLLRGVQALFADVRKIPRESGRITSGLLENAAKPSEVIARGYALTDVSAGRMYEPPKGLRWGLKDLEEAATAPEALRLLAKHVEGDLGAVPPAAQLLLLRLWVGAILAGPSLVQAVSDVPFEIPSPKSGRMPALYPRQALHAAHTQLLRDSEPDAALDPSADNFDAVEAVRRDAACRGAVVLAVHVERALEEYRAAPEAERAAGPLAAPVRLGRDEGRWDVVVWGPEGSAPESEGWSAITLDLGGDDTWTGPTASSMRADVPVSLHVDLGGHDVYRSDEPGQIACGLLGAALLIDLAGDDTYDVKESGLGCGLLGTGVLWDLAGNDSYRSRGPWGQGCGHVGVGALIDLDGDDDYECNEQAQGLGLSLGAGLLVDVGGNDTYVARDDGNVSELYLGQSVAMSQGCGYGRRADIGDGHSLAGGVGILVDGAGDDRYHAQVWAQGCGYWWGLGILEDRGGDDAYQNGKYSAGAAAHFAVGVCIDLAGDDLHNAYNLTAKNQFQGHARDGSIGVFVDGDGDDAYDVNHNCAGSADLNSIALFWDRRGSDRYTFHPQDLDGPSNGWNDTGAFGTATRYTPFFSFRDDLPSWGIFLDTDGQDTYVNDRVPKGWTPTPAADGATWKPQPGPLVFGLGYDL